MAREFEDLLTTEQLANKLGLKPRGVQSLAKRRVIPVYRISHSCVRYRLSEVETALERYRTKEIS
jgi:hypothetical protein